MIRRKTVCTERRPKSFVQVVVFFCIPLFVLACQPTKHLLPTPVTLIPISTPLSAPTKTVTAVPAITPPQPTQTNVPTATPCAESGQIETAVFTTQTVGQFNYRIYKPPCYGQDGHLYPTLYMLPGNNHTDKVWDRLGLDEAAEQLIQAQQILPLLIVMADGGWIANNTSGGVGSYETLILNELIPHIEQTTCAWSDPKGRAIGGLSRGGYWALEIAFRHPEQFVSVGGHSAALLDIAAGPTINPQQTGLNNNLGDLRIYFDIGQADYLIYNIQRLHEEMETAVIQHTWILNKGDHNEIYWRNHTSDYLIWYSQSWQQKRADYPPCP